ncbi:hypothetical protein Aduo_015138 [Ancylostoma duodenale]
MGLFSRGSCEYKRVTQDDGCDPSIGGALLHNPQSKEEHDNLLAKDVPKDLLKELDNLSKKELRTAELGNETNAGQSKEEHAKISAKAGPKETLKEVVASKEREASKSVNSADTTHSSGVEAGGNKANASQQASADGDSHKEKIRKKLSKKSSNAGSKEKPVRSEYYSQ